MGGRAAPLPPPVPFVAVYAPVALETRRPIPPAAWTGPILPPPSVSTVYFPLVVAPATVERRFPMPSHAWTGPTIPQSAALPPFGWWPDYLTTLPVVTYTADIVGVFSEGPEPVLLFRRTLQLRIGSRTEPDKL